CFRWRAHTFPGPCGGGGRIRTFEGVSRQIYSLLPLAAWVPLRENEPRILISRPWGVNASWRAICLAWAIFSQGSGGRVGLGVVQGIVQLLKVAGEKALELVSGIVDRFREGDGFVACQDRRSPFDPGFQAADFVPLARLCTIEVAQVGLDLGEAAAEALE